MKLYLCLMCLLALPGGYFSENPGGQVDNSLLPEIVFPKDRHYPFPRIIGGEVASPNSHPYQVALYVYMPAMTYFCGGTLITPRWVLTAAHCLSEGALYVIAILGAHDLTAQEPTRITINTTSFVYHSNWSITTFQDDIGLVDLNTNVTLNENITTIPFARGNNLFHDRVGVIAGWGLTETGGNAISPVLRHVNVSILSNEECSNSYPTIIVNSHLCTSGSGIVGSCSGDSGGPLIVDGVQVGIVSFGTSNCTLGYPSVFARISHYTDWIEQYVPAGSDSNFKMSFGVLSALCLLHFFIYL